MLPRFPLALLVASALVLPGCLSLGSGIGPASTAEGLPVVLLGDVTATGTTPATWEGRLAGEEVADVCVPFVWICNDLPACTERSCETIPFEIAIPPGYWDAHDGAVEISVYWDHEDALFDLEVFREDGTSLGFGDWAYYASTFLMEEAESGRYLARVRAMPNGEGEYTGLVQVDARPVYAGEARDLLPNLVTLTPKDVWIDLPAYGNDLVFDVPEAARLALARATPGCTPDEVAEKGARRCLRLSNAVANVGEGPLEVFLRAEEGAASLQGNGQFYQRIHRTDGTWRDEPVGKAFFHTTHRHLHYQGIATYEVYEHDLKTGTRGALVGEGKKAGFCLANEGLVDPGFVGTARPVWRDCFLPNGEGWSMGIDPGWFDRYETYRSDQYVEISGVPDGVYELVSRANGDLTLQESSFDDNEASVVFRLTGNTVDLLSGA